MANLTKTLLDAISIIANKTIEEVSSDKTIKAIVEKVVSTSEGKYFVTCNGGSFYAYTQSGSTEVYQEGEQVYILVPEDDMGQKKFIIGKTENGEDLSPKSSTTGLLNDYVTLGDNAIIENKYSAEEGEIKTHKMQPLSLNSHLQMHYYYCYLRNPNNVSELDNKYDNFNYPCVSIDEEGFSNSSKNAKALLIRSKFKASIDTDKIGNYGIIVNIAFADTTNPQTDENGETIYPPRLIAYVLDTSKMTGNPMRFYDYTSQYTIENFDGENFLYIDSIIAFSEGFVDQDIAAHDDDDDIYIYIDKLEIVALDEISATENGYKLRLTTPWGNTIKQGETKDLKISANLSYLGQIINKDAVFYWGVKDPSITSTADGYNFKIGTGYRYLDNKKDELILNVGDLTAKENTYICTVTYESSIVLKAFVSLYNNNNDIDITIESDQGINFQFNEGNPTLTCLINGKTRDYQDKYSDSAFSFVWSKEDEEFGTIVLDGTKAQLEKERDEKLQDNKNSDKITEILSYYATRISQLENISYPNGVHGPQITCKLKNTNNYAIYSCSVYRGGVYVGYGSITLQNFKNVINNNYYITITNGSQVFQYNEAGIAPNSEKVKNPINVLDLTAVFHNPQGAEVTPKRVRWVVPRDRTLINIPTLGLQTDVVTGEKYYSGEVYPLSIKDSYDSQCNNNQLTVIVTHADGTEYRQTTNLLFTKIGEIGTNGTDTTVKINEITTLNIPVDEPLTIIKESNNIKYNNGNFINIPALEANLYTNNNQVLGYNTKWTIAGISGDKGRTYKVSSANNNSNECIIGYDGDLTKLDIRIVEAEISLQGKYYHSFYGIPAIEYESGYDYEHYPIRIIDKDTLKTVLYDSSGNNPIYNENQGIHVELENWNGYLEWTATGGLEDDNNYRNPNLLLSKTPRVKEGSTTLKITDNIANIQAEILNIQDIGQACVDGAIDAGVREYIKRFLNDIEQIAADGLLTIPMKLDLLWNRLNIFLKETPNRENNQINTVYQIYSELFETIKEEYELQQNINAACTKPYDAVQTIWNSEWPSVITGDRLHIQNNMNANDDISNIEQLVERYKQVYNSRSNSDNTITIDKNTLFDKTIKDYLDKYNNNTTYTGHSLLVECTQVLMAYLNLLIDETSTCLDSDNYNYPSNDLKQKVKNQYDLIISDWNLDNIKENIKAVIKASGEEMAEVYNGVRKIYTYYQQLFLNIQKYNVAEESDTLSVWMSLLKGQNPQQLNWIYVIPDSKKSFNGLYMNNNVVGTVYINNNVVAKIYVPIIMTLNTYELAALNGWDGTNVEIGDDHILTPQIGAGIKDSATNTFTGMVMGAIRNTATPDSNKIESVLDKADRTEKVGLIGYSNGKQSIFIDAKTGSTYLGLPEQDSNVGIDEGRIELIPGGVSKIGNWKIGNRFLYNIVNGSYEKRKDIDHPNLLEKMMVPHDKHGIILSSDNPYIHIKGEVYKDKNLSGINYEDEYNNINPGDSLELRMDPGNKSLFSIIQHTSGFGDEDTEGLLFGYKSTESSIETTVIKSYTANQNINEYGENQVENGAEYYIYKLITDPNTGESIPYYNIETLSILSNINKSFTENLYSGQTFLKDVLTWTNFVETGSSNPVFSINKDTGLVTYDPKNLKWENNEEKDNWQSLVWKTSSFEDFSVDFKYNKVISTSDFENNKNIIISNFKNETTSNIYKMKIKNCSLSWELIETHLNNFANNYVRFYIVSNEDDNFENAFLVSENIDILENQNKNIDIELSSFNNKFLSNDNTIEYYLKMEICLESYIVDSSCSCTVKGESNSSKNILPAAPRPYTTIDITEVTTQGTYGEFIVPDGFGRYRYYYSQSESKYNFQVIVYANENSNGTNNKSFIYDFILWNNDGPLVGGQVVSINNWSSSVSSGDWGKIFTFTPTEWEELDNHAYLNIGPSSNNPCHISFYQKGAITEDIIEYSNNNTDMTETSSTEGIQEEVITLTIDVDPETGERTITENTSSSTSSDPEIVVVEGGTEDNLITKYKLIDENIISMDIQNLYDTINWGTWNSQDEYNKAKVFWEIKLVNISFDKVVGLLPEDNSSILCIKDNNNNIFQGRPFVKTYWDEDKNQKILFYKEYYNQVNKANSNISQYGYIDIDHNNGRYYKYIKTLPKNIVNSWFEKNINNENIDILWETCKNIANWKEFVRVGLDENGRFFSSGLQDKKTYSHTGKIYSFGKASHLYGQEIRTEQSSNNYIPIIKIFSQFSDLNTSYITQGKNDNGNISIRTAGSNHYVELAASQFSSNETNSIPDKTDYIQVGYNGIQIQTNKGNSLINLKNDLSIKTNSILIQNNAETTPDFKYEITNNQTRIKSLSYILSSLDSNINILTEKDYKIEALSNKNNDSNSMIRLEVGPNDTELNIVPDKIVLRSNRKRYFEINGNENSVTSLSIDNMKLNFDTENKTIALKNNNRYSIELNSNEEKIILQSGQNKIAIGNEIVIKGNSGIIVENSSTFNRKLYVKSGLYSDKNLYVGYNDKTDKSTNGLIYLYNDDNKHYVKISAENLKQLFDWYNNCRWAIGCYGNTVILRNIANNPTPEGEEHHTVDNSGHAIYTYKWNLKKLKSYYY